MTKSYKIVERLLSRKSGILADEENLGYYDNNMAAEDEQAASLIKEMGEALELAQGYVSDTANDQLALANSRVNYQSIHARESARYNAMKSDLDRIDSILSKLKEE